MNEEVKFLLKIQKKIFIFFGGGVGRGGCSKVFGVGG